jgi:hypothetical protein
LVQVLLGDLGLPEWSDFWRIIAGKGYILLFDSPKRKEKKKKTIRTLIYYYYIKVMGRFFEKPDEIGLEPLKHQLYLGSKIGDNDVADIIDHFHIFSSVVYESVCNMAPDSLRPRYLFTFPSLSVSY